MKKKCKILSALILVLFAHCAYNLKNQNVIEESPASLKYCNEKSTDTVLAQIEGLSDAILMASKLSISDSIYLCNNIFENIGIENKEQIISKLQKERKVLISTSIKRYPFISIWVARDRDKLTIDIGMNNQEMAGTGTVYELIKIENKYQIGKVVDLWKS